MPVRKSKAAPKPSPLLIRDSREQTGWTFPAGDDFGGTEVRTLQTGDYTIEGYEKVFSIERKGSVVEFAQNLMSKDKWPAFQNELGRLAVLPMGVILCEFTLDDVMLYPQTAKLPWSVKRKIRIRPEYYLKRVMEITVEFGPRILFAGPNFGKEIALSLCKRVREKWPVPPV